MDLTDKTNQFLQCNDLEEKHPGSQYRIETATREREEKREQIG